MRVLHIDEQRAHGDDDVVDECPLRVKHRRILCLADREPGGVVHGDVLHGCERRARCFPAVDADVAHVADIKNAYAIAHRLMFGYQSAARGVLHRHIPATKIHHLCAKTAVQRVQWRLAED